MRSMQTEEKLQIPKKAFIFKNKKYQVRLDKKNRPFLQSNNTNQYRELIADLPVGKIKRIINNHNYILMRVCPDRFLCRVALYSAKKSPLLQSLSSIQIGQ